MLLTLENAVEFHDNAAIIGVYPAFATFGDTNLATQSVVIKGENFVNSNNLVCKFGNLSPVRAEFLSSSRIACTPPLIATPTGDEVNMAISISNNNSTFTSSDLKFSYFLPPKVSEVSERSARALVKTSILAMNPAKWLQS